MAAHATPIENTRDRALALSRLAPRQVEILQALADGLNMIEIAKDWNVSHGYIKTQCNIIRAVLGADTNPQAVAMGIRRGLID